MTRAAHIYRSLQSFLACFVRARPGSPALLSSEPAGELRWSEEIKPRFSSASGPCVVAGAGDFLVSLLLQRGLYLRVPLIDFGPGGRECKYCRWSRRLSLPPPPWIPFPPRAQNGLDTSSWAGIEIAARIFIGCLQREQSSGFSR